MRGGAAAAAGRNAPPRPSAAIELAPCVGWHDAAGRVAAHVETRQNPRPEHRAVFAGQAFDIALHLVEAGGAGGGALGAETIARFHGTRALTGAGIEHLFDLKDMGAAVSRL